MRLPREMGLSLSVPGIIPNPGDSMAKLVDPSLIKLTDLIELIKQYGYV